MQALEKKGPERTGSEERWRLLILGVVVLVMGGLMVTLASRPRLNGKVDPVSHVAAKSREDTAKLKAEVDQRFKEGVAMLHAKQYEYALTAFHRVLQIAPEMPEAHVNAGYALLGLEKPKAARDFFDAAINLRPDQINAYFGLAEALAELGDKFGAMQAMETYVHRAPADDPFRTKAMSAAWELRAQLEEEKAKLAQMAGQPAAAAKTGGK